MTPIRIDADVDDAERRQRTYDGEILVHTSGGDAIVAHARSMLEGAFPRSHPCDAQHTLPVEGFAAILAELKPAFIHHPVSWQRIAAWLVTLGCDPQTTYLDVPRLRISTSDGYLVSGVAYAHHPHRDTWWAAPLQQLNWWLPIYPFVPESGMAFHPHYWTHAVPNDSARFSYADWNSNQRKHAAQHVGRDTRWQPHAIEPLDRLEPEIRLVVPPGGAIVFSGAQLHSTCPNRSGRTRFSIDFRTVDIRDVRDGRGAPNLDSLPSGTSLRDFRRLADGARVDDALAARFEAETPARDGLIFQPV